MRIPDSFHYAYLREQKAALRIQRAVDSRLRRLCHERRWLFDGRVKEAESVLAKLQLGELASIEAMNDIYAATVVVATRNEIDSAVSAIKGIYDRSEVKVRRRGSPETFIYDDTHILTALGRTATGEPAAVRDRIFEIQVRTGLQFSWWKATHKALYKGSVRDWRLERTAYQVRGTLEMIDSVLADLEQAAGLLAPAPGDRDTEFERVVAWLDRWSADQQPADRRRFVDTVTGWLKDAGVGLDRAEELLAGARGKELVEADEVTPAQAMIALAADDTGVDALCSGGRRLLVTDELAEVSDRLAATPEAQRVSLTPA